MDRLDSMTLFTRVAETGSFSLAAKEFNISQSAVSKRIANLEKKLNTKLLRRTTRQLKLTDIGKDYYERCVTILRDVEEAESAIKKLQSGPTGTIKVSTSVAFGTAHILPKLNRFLDLHPGLNVSLHLTDRQTNLVQEGIDIAIRMGNLEDSDLSAKRICTSPMITVASPAHFAQYGFPSHPCELSERPCVLYAGRDKPRKWRFQEDGSIFYVTTNGRFLTNDASAYRDALLENLGIGVVPLWLVGDLIQKGELLPTLEEFGIEPLPIHAVYPPGKRTPEKVRHFVDFLVKQLNICKAIN
ncbi:MAG: LysR family transcriptional regulator [Gammaproteobacteria bacterium]|nr:LysR family transcriptional regulator [Gammaproteobacteria bacterium]